MSLEGKVAILGAGEWGTTVANVIAENHENYCIDVWDVEPKVLGEINQHNARYFEKFTINLPKNIIGNSQLECAVDNSEFIFFVTPSHAIAETALELSFLEEVIEKNPIIVCMAKGFGHSEKDKNKENPKRLLDLIAEVLPKRFKNNLVYVSGPSIAAEVAEKVNTGLVCASRNLEMAKKVKKLLSPNENHYLAVYLTKDVTGVQIGGAAKNPYAIMYGILEEAQKHNLNIDSNTLALYKTRALAEMIILAKHFSIRSYKKTITGLAGCGDLDVTCAKGRNSKFGRNSASDYFKENIDFKSSVKNLDYTVEGVGSTRAIHLYAKKHRLNLPIIECLYRILYENSPLKEEIPNLFRRTKAEHEHIVPYNGNLKDIIMASGRNLLDLAKNLITRPK